MMAPHFRAVPVGMASIDIAGLGPAELSHVSTASFLISDLERQSS
jgi:hypothetical protein